MRVAAGLAERNETGPSEAELMQRVEALAPLIRRNLSFQEEQRRMAPEVFEALSNAGLFALWKPAAVGGFECNAVTALKVFEALSRIDASVGWAVANQDGIDSMAGAVLPSDGALEMLADPHRPVSGASFPLGVARPGDGGYFITGRWAFSSTCHYAQTFMGLALIYDENEQVVTENGMPLRLLVFTKSSDVQILDTWRTMGMRGSGSHDIAMNNLFVPKNHTGLMGLPNVATEGPLSGPVYGSAPWLSIATSGPVGLGMAQAALDLLVELAQTKTPNYTVRALRDRDKTQEVMGRGQAVVNAARTYLHTSVEAVYSARCDGRRPTKSEGIDVQLATCAALEAGAKVTELVHDVVGSTGFQEDSQFQQLFRDSHTLSQNTFASSVRYEAAGQVLLGMPTDWGILAWALAR